MEKTEKIKQRDLSKCWMSSIEVCTPYKNIGKEPTLRHCTLCLKRIEIIMNDPMKTNSQMMQQMTTMMQQMMMAMKGQHKVDVPGGNMGKKTMLQMGINQNTEAMESLTIRKEQIKETLKTKNHLVNGKELEVTDEEMKTYEDELEHTDKSIFFVENSQKMLIDQLRSLGVDVDKKEDRAEGKDASA